MPQTFQLQFTFSIGNQHKNQRKQAQSHLRNHFPRPEHKATANKDSDDNNRLSCLVCNTLQSVYAQQPPDFGLGRSSSASTMSPRVVRRPECASPPAAPPPIGLVVPLSGRLAAADGPAFARISESHMGPTGAFASHDLERGQNYTGINVVLVPMSLKTLSMPLFALADVKK